MLEDTEDAKGIASPLTTFRDWGRIRHVPKAAMSRRFLLSELYSLPTLPDHPPEICEA